MSISIFKYVIRNILDSLGYQLSNSKQFGNNILNDLRTILPSDRELIAFDIGANLGQTTIEFANAFKKSLIYSFEPDPAAFLELEKKVKTYPNIKTYNVGFGDKNGKIQMNINKGSGGNSILSVSDKINAFASGDWTERIGQTDVEITTLNSFCEANHIDRIDLIKIDTQGYEINILKGGGKVLSPTFTKVVYIEVLFVELYKEQAYFIDVFKILTERGYKLVGIYNKFYSEERPHFLLWCDAIFVSESI